MKHSLIFDKLGKCKGCKYSVPGPTAIMNVTSMCTWCERNPFLITEIKDQYEKTEIVIPEDLEIDNSSVEDDSNPALEANKEFLSDWGISAEALEKMSNKRKKKRKKKSNGDKND